MLLFTGKGGVGKTSLAAATAVRAAVDGARVLVTSTDAAHSLADALDHPLGDRPTVVPLVGAEPGAAAVTAGDGRGVGVLHAQQLDAQQRLERHWGEVRDYLSALLTWGGLGEVAAEELMLFPGLDELFALIDLEHQVASEAYDLIVVDCAPTAETLKLLALPDAVRFYADRMLGPGRRLIRSVGARTLPRSATGTPFPVPDDTVFDAVGNVHERLAAVHRLMTDTARTSIRLVANPERLVLREAQRSATTLSLFGYGVDAVLVNRVLPDDVEDTYLAGWVADQRAHLQAAVEAFGPIPVLPAPHTSREPIGTAALAALADACYHGASVTDLLYHVPPLALETTEDGHELRIALPFATDEDVELHRRSGELHLKVAGTRRNLALPAALQRARVTSASLEDGWLTVRFTSPVAAVS